ncbi:MAG: acyl carrier protein [Nitrospiraceae bacterium]
MTDRNDVKARMAEFLQQPTDRLGEEMVLGDLVSDSMILVNMVIELQEEFGVRLVHHDLEHVTTVGQLLTVFENKFPG